LRVATNPIQLQVDEAQIVFAARNVRPQLQELVVDPRAGRLGVILLPVLLV